MTKLEQAVKEAKEAIKEYRETFKRLLGVKK